jgi:hypothetical protein
MKRCRGNKLTFYLLTITCGLFSCRQEKIDSSISISTLKRCEQILPLFNGQILTTYRDFYPYENTFRSDTYLCLYDSNHKLIEYVPFWGKIDSFDSNSIKIKIYEKHPNNRNPLKRLHTKIGSYQLHYSYYSAPNRGGMLTTNKLLDSLAYNDALKKVKLYYRIKTQLNQKETQEVDIWQLRWEPSDPSVNNSGNEFYVWSIIENGKMDLQEYFTPKDSLVTEKYFQSILSKPKP